MARRRARKSAIFSATQTFFSRFELQKPRSPSPEADFSEKPRKNLRVFAASFASLREKSKKMPAEKLLFETVRLENGAFERLDFHQKRLDASRSEFFENAEPIALAELLAEHFEKNLAQKSRAERAVFSTKCHRTRVIFGQKLERVEFFEYTPKPIRKVKIIEAPRLEYSKKWLDRSVFDHFLAQNPDFDDLLFLKNGRVTDTTFACPAFFDGKKWRVPSEPLLHGTRRASLLADGKIFEDEIGEKDLRRFKKWSLLNAMRGLEIELPMSVFGF